MVDIDRFYEMLDEICEEFPDDFFRELHYGVQLSEDIKLSPHAEDGDLVILGEYSRSLHGNKITIFYGSFEEACGSLSEEELYERLREVVRHEFRHHMENLAGIFGEDSLDREDKEELKDYVQSRKKNKQKKTQSD